MGKVEKLRHVNGISENQPFSLMCLTKKIKKKKKKEICVEEKKDLNFHSELAYCAI